MNKEICQVREIENEEKTMFIVDRRPLLNKSLCVMIAGKNPIGDPPIYPVYQGTLTDFRGYPAGTLLDYRASALEAKFRAYELALQEARETGYDIVDETTFKDDLRIKINDSRTCSEL